MSRHRFVKKINIDDELEDNALSDGGEDDLTPEQQEQLDMAFAQARSVLGPETSSGISDEQIKNAAWDNFFDVETTVEWLLKEQIKRNAAKEKEGEETPTASLPLWGLASHWSSFFYSPEWLGSGHFGYYLVQSPHSSGLHVHTSVNPPDAPPTSPQPPLSALQQLSLAHKKSAQANKASLLALALGRTLDHNALQEHAQASTSNFSTFAKHGQTEIAENVQPLHSASPSPPNRKLPSKLSLLAKAKASQPSTSHTLLSSSDHIPSPTISLPGAPTLSPKNPSLSKLALKIQKVRDKPPTLHRPVPTKHRLSVENAPLFCSFPTRMQATPSSFALLLVPHRGDALKKPEGQITLALRRPSSSFTFDTPSPDDIILSARRGTKLISHTRRT